MKVDPRFLDLVNYGVCSALSRTHGREGAERVFRLAGEIAFKELNRRLRFESLEPYDVLRAIARFLEESGYMERIELTKVSPGEVIVNMYGVSVAESSKRLVDEGSAPSHYMTNLMFAALKELCGVKAEIIHLELDREKGTGKEKWVLSKIEG